MKKIIGFSAFISASILTVAFAFAIIPTAHAQTATTCPAGYTCTPVTSPTSEPSIAISQNGSYVGNGVTFSIQAGNSSGMQVNYITTDFNSRAWLYFSNISLVNQTTGRIIASASLNQSNFVEINVGQDYRYVFSGLNFLVPHGQTVKVVLKGISRYSSINGAVTTTQVISASVRAVDSSGVTHTASTIPSTSTNGIVASLNSSSPQASTVQISTSAQTNNVPLAVFDIKSQGGASILQSLQLNLNVNNSNGQNGFGALLNTVSIRVGGQTYFGTPFVSSCPVGYTCTLNSGVMFSNMNVALPADIYVPVTVYATIAQDTNNSLDGSSASVSLPTYSIQAVDSNYNSVPVTNSGTISGSTITFTGVAGGVQVSNTSAMLGNPICNVATQACSQQATFTFSLTAGNQPIYVPKTQLSGAVPTGGSSMAATLISFRDSDTTSDSSTYFYVAPGQTKTLTANYQFTSGYGIFAIGSIYYGTSPSNLTSNSITSGLQNLQVTVNFGGGSTSVCPAGYICTPPNQTMTCPVGYTCTPVAITSCPAGYTCYTEQPTTTTQPPVISGGTFPTQLNVDQTGTWTVNASDPQNGSLSYSVNWGDQPTVLPSTGVMSSAVVQTSTFTHSYSSAGTYTITFTIKNAAGLSAQTTSTVQVGGVITTCPVGCTCTGSTTSCPVRPTCPVNYICTPINQTQSCPAGYTCTNVTSNCPPSFICSTQTPITTTACSKDLKMCPDGSGVGRVPPSCEFATCPATVPTKTSITVVSPNGGENWQVGNTQIISWKYTGQSGLGVDVYLAHPMGGYCYIGTASADSGVYNFLLSNRCVDNGYVKPPQSSLIVSGKYKVLVNLQSGDARVPLASDLSNNYFTITSHTIPTHPTTSTSQPTGISASVFNAWNATWQYLSGK